MAQVSKIQYPGIFTPREVSTVLSLEAVGFDLLACTN
jgi:hypothetical protein